MPDGYGTSDEMATVAGAIERQVTPINQQAEKVDDPVVTAADFGRAFHSHGQAYATAIKEHVSAPVRAYSEQTSILSTRLHDSYQQYGQSEDHNSAKMRGTKA